MRPQTYANLREDLDRFGNAVRNLEADATFDLSPHPSEAADNERMVVLRGLGKALYFCVPRNDKLLGYWDIVADRLFKIRNSLNIQGIFRQLPLFEPPIDPALLARAAAAGLDVGAIVSGLNQPLPLVRFQLLVQKAAEIAQEVKSLGSSFLSAIEKEDGEAMALLRAKHERVVLEMAEHVKYGQWQEAIKAREGLQQSLANAVQRYTFYELQLGKKPEEIEKAIPALDELDKDSLAKMKFAMKELDVALRSIDVDIAQGVDESRGKIVSRHEQQELTSSRSARDWQVRSSVTAMIANVSHYIPTLGVDFEFWGLGGHMEFGGEHVGPAFEAISKYQGNLSSQDSYDAGHAGKIGGFQRRELDWAFQSNLAAGEINQIARQLRGAQIGEALAERELANHREQIKQAQEVEFFLTGEKNPDWTQKINTKEKKVTNKALYTWMKREVKGLYGQCFQFAFDVAKKAERALQHELGTPELTTLQFGYLAGKEGLLAGEKLYLDIKRMEMSYYELNQREYELTKHISLLQTNPLALIQLRKTGRCTIRLPEMLFDMDGPGHYFRRIKTVALSVPCVVGPYANVNCTLTLLKSTIRKNQNLRDGAYARADSEDIRFNDYFGSLQSIVTSSAQNDTGLFDANLRDERYLPFENSGVISEWQLQLPANPTKGEPRQFDYDTISDVIFHVRYTAREGGELLRKGALDNLKETFDAAQGVGSVRLFSLRHEFPGEWASFQSQTPAANQRFELKLNLRDEHYPFWSNGRLNNVKRVDILAVSSATPTPARMDMFQNAGLDETKKGTLVKDATLGNLLVGQLTDLRMKQPNGELAEKPTGELSVYFENKALRDLWVAVTWSGA
jgi:hypothetical protein